MASRQGGGWEFFDPIGRIQSVAQAAMEDPFAWLDMEEPATKRAPRISPPTTQVPEGTTAPTHKVCKTRRT